MTEACAHRRDPGEYPHLLTRKGGHVFLVSRLADSDFKETDLGGDPEVQTAYARYDHLRTAHDRESANLFLWGFMTGMAAGLGSVAIMKKLDSIIDVLGRRHNPETDQ